MWFCHRKFSCFDFLFLIPQYGANIYTYFVSLLFMTHKNVLGFLGFFICFVSLVFFYFVLHTIANCCLLKCTTTTATWIRDCIQNGSGFQTAGNTGETETHMHRSFCPRWELGSSGAQWVTAWGLTAEILLLVLLGLRRQLNPCPATSLCGIALSHRRHAGGRAFFLLKTTAALQRSSRKIQLEGQVLTFCFLGSFTQFSVLAHLGLISGKLQKVKWPKVQKLKH